MKKTILIASLLLGALAVSAQTSQAQFEKTLPDSVLYMLPSFGQGRVVFSDGQYSNGLFNVCTLDQTVRYLDKDGSVMVLADNASVDRVVVGNTLFLHNQGQYIAIVDTAGEIMLGYNRKIVINDSKRGAYGTESQTTNITQVNKVDDAANGVLYDFTGDVKYKIKEGPYLVRKNIVYQPTKTTFAKCFPDKKAFLKEYLKDHKVNWNDAEDVTALFNLMKQ